MKAVFRGRPCTLEEHGKHYRIRYTDEPEPRRRRGTAGAYPPIRMINKRYADRLMTTGDITPRAEP